VSKTRRILSMRQGLYSRFYDSSLDITSERISPIYRQPRPVPVINPAIGRRGLLIARSYYFLFFGAIGCLVPFLNVYLKEIGLTGTQIGWLGSIAPLIALAANPIWGAIADRWQIHRQVLALCALMAGGVTLFFLLVVDFWLLLVLVTILAFFRTPIGSIVDSAVMDMARQGNSSYGHQRLWGTVGFVLATLGLGQLLKVDALDLIFWLHAGLLGIGCVALSFLLPVESAQQRVGLGQGLRLLLGRRNYAGFLIATTLLGMGVVSFVSFLALHILALGGDEQQISLAWALNAAMEIPVMYFGARLSQRYGYRRLLLAAFLGFSLAWMLVGLSLTATLVIILLPGVGISFGFFWIAAVGYASESAPPGLSATAQALMGAAMSGLGWSLGSVVAGYLWDNASGHAVFFFAAVMALLATLIFWLSNRAEEG
jgi:PPP family 3-phenylpropionic acid transporter